MERVESKSSGYSHTQRAPFCLMLYCSALACIVLSWGLRDEPPIRFVVPPISLLVLVLSASFHLLTVKGQGDRLLISFGPIPLFRRSVRYEDIQGVEIGKTTILDGWGIHLSLRGGWVWNIWGWDCVVVHLKNGTLRIGTNDAPNLWRFLETKIAH